MEWVAGMPWNGWPGCHGMAGRDGLEYADTCLLRVSNCVIDEGGPFGAGDRKRVPNHCKLRS